MTDPTPPPDPNAGPDADANATVRQYLTYAAAGAMLGMTSDAVRMKCRRGTLVCETVDGQRMVVWPQPEQANERRTANDDRDRRDGGGVRSDAASFRVSMLEAQLARAERERDGWQEAFRDQSERLDQAMSLAAAAQRLAEQERDRADQLAASLDRHLALAERTNDRTPTATVATADTVRDGETGPAAAAIAPKPKRRGPVATVKAFLGMSDD